MDKSSTRFLWILMILFLCIGQLFSQNKQDFSTGSLSTISVRDVLDDDFSFPLSYLEDPEGKMTPEEVLGEKDFSVLSDGRFTYPYNRSAHWFGFILNNDTSFEQNLVLHSDEPFLDLVDLHQRNKDGSWNEWKNGLQVPIEERDFKNRMPGFRLTLKPGETGLFLVRIKTERTLLNVGLQLEPDYEFDKEDKLKGAIYLLFLGSIISILLYNLFLLISLRDSIYLYYVIYAFFQGIWVLLYSGYDMYLYSDYRINHFLSCGISISSISLILFISEILDLKKNMPRIHKAIRLLLPVLVLLALATIINVRYYAIVVSFGMPVSLFLLIIVIRGFIAKIPQSDYLLFGMAWYIIGLFIIAGVNMGLIPFSEFSRNAFLAGSFIEFIVFSLTLASRVQSLQQSTLHAKSEVIRLKQETNVKLTAMVEKKTEELEKANKELQAMVIKDPLTGLFNRRYLEEFLHQEWSRHIRSSKPISIMMLDIDHFKKYNDSFGHMKGDQCLIDVAAIIRDSARRSSDMTARYGGEEFIVVLPETDEGNAKKIAQKILSSLNEKKIPHMKSIGIVSVSIGISSVIPKRSLSFQELIKSADEALYESKKNGRNRMTVHW